jgi:hypothetical protein
MKRLAPHASNQLPLPLLTPCLQILPHETQRALVRLLMDLLLTAIPRHASPVTEGGRHAGEADR